jgi:hypothetical protein
MVGSIPHAGLLDYYRQEAQAVKDRLEGKKDPSVLPGSMVALLPPPINTPTIAFGLSGIRYDIDADGLFRVKEEDVGPLQSAGYRRHYEKT